MDNSENSSSHRTILILSFCLLGLILLLIFLYKKLNKEAHGEYGIRRMVYKEGGIRDQARNMAATLETRLGVRLWPQRETDEEMQEVGNEEARLDKRSSRGSCSKGDDQESEGEEDDEERNETESAPCVEAKYDSDDTSGDDTRSDSSDEEERTRGTDQPEANKGMEEKVDEVESKGGSGLLIDLVQLAGSATWAEEDGGVTAL